jgi:hypothetical protein
VQRTGSAIMVDFADVTFVYAVGRELLTRMYRQGVMLVSSGLLVKAVIARTNHCARCYQELFVIRGARRASCVDLAYRE